MESQAQAINDVAVVNRWLDLFTMENIGDVLSILFLILVIVGFIRTVLSDKNDLNLMDMFLPLGSSKMRLNGAWLIASWAFVYLTLGKNLTEWFVAGYLAAFVLDRFNARKHEKESAPAKEEKEKIP